MKKETKTFIITAFVILAMMVCSVMAVLSIRQERLIERQVYEEANSLYDAAVMMRRWSSGLGGMYVRKHPGQKSTPYLKNPDITDTAGNVYTLKSPATMTREISQLSESSQHFRLHVTSLLPRDPYNRPDAWERKSLLDFEKGLKERAEVIKVQGNRYYRLMRPLYVENSCLGCHADQGYKVGDVRGGMSITVPYNAYYSAIVGNYLSMAGLALLLVMVLAGVFYFFVWRLMEKLERQKEELKALNETKDKLMGIAAHDLRNPLVAVSGYAELLESLVTGKSELDLLDGIKVASGKMLGLINGLLDISKIKSGKLELRPRDVDVAEFINETGAANMVVGKNKGIGLKVSVPEGIGKARFDKDRMHQALDNLLSNAFKYSNPGTTVDLGAEKSDGRLKIWVADQGVGIKQDELHLLFGEFSRTSSRPTGGEASHGLGLAITKKVIELHGGEIDVQSAPGAGTRFTISLPLISATSSKSLA